MLKIFDISCHKSEFFSRELCDEYKKKCYYPLYEIEDGYKAKLSELIEKTLPVQLEEIDFHPQNDVDLHLNIGVGLDGAGNFISKRCPRWKVWL